MIEDLTTIEMVAALYTASFAILIAVSKRTRSTLIQQYRTPRHVDPVPNGNLEQELHSIEILQAEDVTDCWKGHREAEGIASKPLRID